MWAADNERLALRSSGVRLDHVGSSYTSGFYIALRNSLGHKTLIYRTRETCFGTRG